MQILYILNGYSSTGDLSFLVYGGVQATTGELRSRKRPPVRKTFSFRHFFSFCLRIPGVALYNHATPGLLKRVCSKFDYRFWPTRLVQQSAGCLPCDSVLRGEYACATGCDEFADNELHVSA